MKENVLDVLMYLFETYVVTDEEPEADQNELRDELSRAGFADSEICLLYTSPSPRDRQKSRMPSSA